MGHREQRGAGRRYFHAISPDLRMIVMIKWPNIFDKLVAGGVVDHVLKTAVLQIRSRCPADEFAAVSREVCSETAEIWRWRQAQEARNHEQQRN